FQPFGDGAARRGLNGKMKRGGHIRLARGEWFAVGKREDQAHLRDHHQQERAPPAASRPGRRLCLGRIHRTTLVRAVAGGRVTRIASFSPAARASSANWTSVSTETVMSATSMS